MSSLDAASGNNLDFGFGSGSQRVASSAIIPQQRELVLEAAFFLRLTARGNEMLVGVGEFFLFSYSFSFRTDLR